MRAQEQEQLKMGIQSELAFLAFVFLNDTVWC